MTSIFFSNHPALLIMLMVATVLIVGKLMTVFLDLTIRRSKKAKMSFDRSAMPKNQPAS